MNQRPLRLVETQDAPRPETTALIPQALMDETPKCWRCKRKLADYLTRPWKLMCTRCRATNASAPSH